MILILVSCIGGKDRVIPRAKLAEIYAEMFLTDQWISSTHSVRRQVDTSLVYEPILARYGYTSDDYRRSVDKYMNDPERFSRILRTTGQILDERLAELRKQEAEIARVKALKEILDGLRYEADFDAKEFFPYLFDEPYVHYYDSLDVKPDSTLMVFRLINIHRSDTLYEGIRMVFKDSLAVKDTLVTDSLKVEDKPEDKLLVAVRDSIPFRKILPKPKGRVINKQLTK
jgi:hypothetical protein